MTTKESAYLLPQKGYEALRTLGAQSVEAVKSGVGTAKEGLKLLARPGRGPFKTLNKKIKNKLRPRENKWIRPATALTALGGLGTYGYLREKQSPRTQFAQDLTKARYAGERPMSTPFESFMSREQNNSSLRRKTSSQNKEAGVGKKLFGAVLDPLKRAVSKTKKKAPNLGQLGESRLFGKVKPSKNIKNKIRSGGLFGGGASAPTSGGQSGLSLKKALSIGTGAAGLGLGLEALEDTLNPVSQTAGEQLAAKIFGPEAAAGAQQERIRSQAKQLGQSTIGVPASGIESAISEAARNLAGKGVEAIEQVPNRMKHERTYQEALQSDEMLQDLTPEEEQSARDAFETMKRFAPTLATDKSAVRNFVREAVISGGGPNYATISNIAKTDRDIRR